jgi:Tol biopolymer transport system component
MLMNRCITSRKSVILVAVTVCSLLSLTMLSGCGGGASRATVRTEGGVDPNIVESGAAFMKSPDGTKIAFAAGTSTRSPDIYVMNTDGSNIQRVASNDDKAFPNLPVWSPDSKKIAYRTIPYWDIDTSEDNMPDLYVVNADGTGKTKVVEGSDIATKPYYDYVGINDNFSWSPDSQKIAFSAKRDLNDTRTIYTAKVDGTNLNRLVTGDEPIWSPDGSKIAYIAHHVKYSPVINIDTTYKEASVMNADGTSPVQLNQLPSQQNPVTGKDYGITWSPNGQNIAFLALRGDASGESLTTDVYTVNVDGTQLKNRTNVTKIDSRNDLALYGIFWSGDGQNIQYSRYQGTADRPEVGISALNRDHYSEVQTIKVN